MKTKKTILISAPTNFIADLDVVLDHNFDYQFLQIRTKNDLENVTEPEAIVGWVVNPCPEFMINDEVLRKFPNIRVISTPSTGKSHIDLKVTADLHINVIGLLDGDAVQTITASSEFTFALALSTLRKIPQALAVTRQKMWRNQEARLRSREISELTIAFIGAGRIGQNVGRYFRAMGAKTKAYDKYLSALELNNKFDVVSESLQSAVNGADVVICCVTSSAETRKLINTNVINKMKDGAVFINTSRGEVVDEVALVEALKTNKLSQVSVDVISGENSDKFLNDSPLFQYSMISDSVNITPHIAGLTTDSESKAQKSSILAAIEYLR